MSYRAGSRQQEQPEAGVSRRRLLARGAAVAAGGGLLLGAAPAATAAQGGRTLTLDVAMDGRTYRLHGRVPGAGIPARGDTFIVSGTIYPGGTIERGLTGPDQPGGIGTWVCRGTVVIENLSDPPPQVVTVQLYQLGNGSLASEGQESGVKVVRPVIGGTGVYSGARGEVIEEELETNDTMIDFGALQAPAPNIRFVFTLRG